MLYLSFQKIPVNMMKNIIIHFLFLFLFFILQTPISQDWVKTSEASSSNPWTLYVCFWVKLCSHVGCCACDCATYWSRNTISGFALKFSMSWMWKFIYNIFRYFLIYWPLVTKPPCKPLPVLCWFAMRCSYAGDFKSATPVASGGELFLFYF
jgi:hypothetical protein